MSLEKRYGKVKAESEAKILTFDIETIPALVWQFSPRDQWTAPEKVERPGYMASFAAKWYNERETMYWDVNTHGKEQMLDAMWTLLNQADIVVGYNQDRFDVKKVNTAFVVDGYGQPAPFRSVDLLKTVRQQFDFPYKRLDYVAQALGVGSKLTHQGFLLWRDCAHGDAKAWRKMERYNRRDVVITERVYDRLRGWIKNHPSLALWSDEPVNKPQCPNCGSTKLARADQNAATLQTLYAQWVCSRCGHHIRAAYIRERVAFRGTL